MTRWSWRSNMPGRSRYEPPTPHVPTPPAGDQPADDTPAASGPPNRSPRFPQHTGGRP